MLRLSAGWCFGFLLLTLTPLVAQPDKPRSARESLQPFNVLIGPWKGTGIPEGSRSDQQRGFWIETMDWSWHFQGADAWLSVSFDKSKHFLKGELRAVPGKDQYQLTLTTPGKQNQVFSGALNERTLTLDRQDPATKETQRLVFRLLHDNRFLYQYQVRPADRQFFQRLYQVGATRQGVPFAQGDGRPECIVSGGLGTTPVTYRGKTYYVCCGGCKTEFEADPEKYIREYEQKQAAAKKAK
jgi:hypothetical protein